MLGRPQEFRPKRFLNSDIDVKGLLIPFGGGKRGCPGSTFAIMVNELALPRIVHKFNFAFKTLESLFLGNHLS
uniref:Cytochrome P450 n=1 Tax=Solanum lycopersicum TaxID=4081 RepID=A0A3Q7FR89_SOLLC